MDCHGGPVLIDFSYPEEASLGKGVCTVSGYRYCDIVLTIAPEFLANELQSRKSSCSAMKISCFWLAGNSIKEEHLVHVSHVWKVGAVANVVRNLKTFKLKPFTVDGEGRFNVGSDISFVLMNFGGRQCDSRTLTDALTKLSKFSKSQRLIQGQDVFTMYAPFGVNEFMNSCSKGCLSNQFKEGLFLIDGRLAPGCEGAPLFTRSDPANHDFPVGMVLFPIAVGNDHSGYSLVVPMDYVIDDLLYPQSSHTLESESRELVSWNSLHSNDGGNNVVIVETPSSWASGVVVSKGLVVTNAHAIAFDQRSTVTVRWKNRTISAQAVFVSNKSSLLDLALLQYNKTFGPPGIRISNEEPEVGEKVIAIGNPLQISSSRPSISKGVVLNYWKKSAGFSSSCIINTGSSGGAIVRKDGSLLGLVVGICKSNSQSYPEINVCICASVLRKPLLSYQETGDVSSLHRLLDYDDSWLRVVMSFPKSKY